MMNSDHKLRVLVVEDEWMIASQIESIVVGAGFAVAGPFGELEVALAVAQTEDLSAALLDVELGPTTEIYPVADALRDRRIPYGFVTSRPRDQIAPAHAHRPIVAKPFEPRDIEALLTSLTRG
jgi:DNA-binding response OmpR family regulator